MLRTKLFMSLVASAAVVLATISIPVLSSTPSPFLGTWILDVAKSTFEPGPPLKSEIWVATSASNGSVHFVDDWVEPDGTTGHVEFTSAFDGRATPVAGSKDFDSTTYKKVSATSYESALIKSGKIVERELHVISADGKTWRTTERGKDSEGKAYIYRLVFNRR